MIDTHVLILAAGMGTRMKSAFPKVLHRVAGRPMIEYALRAISALNVASTTVVVGYGAEQVQTAVGGWPGVQFVGQEPQLGTGHALMQSESALSGLDGTLVLFNFGFHLGKLINLFRHFSHSILMFLL